MFTERSHNVGVGVECCGVERGAAVARGGVDAECRGGRGGGREMDGGGCRGAEKGGEGEGGNKRARGGALCTCIALAAEAGRKASCRACWVRVRGLGFRV